MDTRDETVTGGRMVTRELATWVAGLRYEDLPEPVIEEAGRAFADFLGESLFVGGTKRKSDRVAVNGDVTALRGCGLSGSGCAQ